MSSPYAHAALTIATSLFASIWEGALIVGAVWLALRCLPKLGAATRYAIWLCTLAALVFIPVLTAGSASQSLTAATPVPVSVQSRQNTSVPAAPKQFEAAPVLPEAASVQPEIAHESQPPAPTFAIPQKPHITIPQGLALAAALIWLFVAWARGLLLAMNLRELAAIRRAATLWSTTDAYPILVSDRIAVPIAVGFLRPTIILPRTIIDTLDTDAIEAIVIHEVAHLQRHDVWTNAFARVAEAFVALNPGAWFVMRRLSTEREIACDDWVVARTGRGDAFAHTLAAMASCARGRAPIAAPSAIGSRHSIVVRIERLLDAAPRRLRLSLSALGGALTLIAVFALSMQTVSPVLAYPQQETVIIQAPVSETVESDSVDHSQPTSAKGHPSYTVTGDHEVAKNSVHTTKAHFTLDDGLGHQLLVDTLRAKISAKSILMTGGVHAKTHDGSLLSADRLRYDIRTGKVEADGHVVLVERDKHQLTAGHIESDIRMDDVTLAREASPLQQIASACPVPNRAIRIEGRFPTKSHRIVRYDFPVDSRGEVSRKVGAAHFMSIDFTVDANGKLLRRVVTAPADVRDLTSPYQGLFGRNQTFKPALHNCAPVTSTSRMYMAVKAAAGIGNEVAPIYPAGWSNEHRSSCKVPNLFHNGVLTLTDSMKPASHKAKAIAVVRVHVNADGSVAHAQIVTPSGKPSLDNALLAAAQNETYPLTETSGFNQVRPKGTPPSWNNTHGSETYTGCSPRPTDYLWTSTVSWHVQWRF